MKVKIKLLDDKARVPAKAHGSDFCYDVYATSVEEVEPGIWLYHTGISYEIIRAEEPLGYLEHFAGAKNWGDAFINFSFSPANISIDFRPRSSIWKTGLSLCNCEGTLDEAYRGEILAYFYEVIPGKEKYKVGDRIGQVKLGFTLPIDWEVVDNINTDTERGEGGFGSSGR